MNKMNGKIRESTHQPMVGILVGVDGSTAVRYLNQ